MKLKREIFFNLISGLICSLIFIGVLNQNIPGLNILESLDAEIELVDLEEGSEKDIDPLDEIYVNHFQIELSDYYQFQLNIDSYIVNWDNPSIEVPQRPPVV